MIESLICLIMWLVMYAYTLNSCYTGEGEGLPIPLVEFKHYMPSCFAKLSFQLKKTGEGEKEG